MTPTPEERAAEICGKKAVGRLGMDLDHAIVTAIRAAEVEAEKRGADKEREACADAVADLGLFLAEGVICKRGPTP